MDAFWNSFVRVEFNFDEIRASQNLHKRFYVAHNSKCSQERSSPHHGDRSFGDQIDSATIATPPVAMSKAASICGRQSTCA